MLAYIIAIFGVAFSTTDDARSESESSFIQLEDNASAAASSFAVVEHEDNASSFALLDDVSYTASFVHVGESLPADASDLQAQEEIITLREQVQNLQDRLQERAINPAQRITNAENEEDHPWMFDVFENEETPQDHEENTSTAGNSFAVFGGTSSYVNVGDDHSLSGDASDFRLQQEITALREQVQNLQAQLQHEPESTTQRIADAENAQEEDSYALQPVRPQTRRSKRVHFINVKLAPIISCIFFGRPVPMLTWRSVDVAIEDETEDEPLVRLAVRQHSQPSSSPARESYAEGRNAVIDFKARRECELLEVVKKVVPCLKECVEHNAQCMERKVVTHVVPEVKNAIEHIVPEVKNAVEHIVPEVKNAVEHIVPQAEKLSKVVNGFAAILLSRRS